MTKIEITNSVLKDAMNTVGTDKKNTLLLADIAASLAVIADALCIAVGMNESEDTEDE